MGIWGSLYLSFCVGTLRFIISDTSCFCGLHLTAFFTALFLTALFLTALFLTALFLTAFFIFAFFLTAFFLTALSLLVWLHSRIEGFLLFGRKGWRVGLWPGRRLRLELHIMDLSVTYSGDMSRVSYTESTFKIRLRTKDQCYGTSWLDQPADIFSYSR
ncbi:hypothetical protein EYF80_054354 [Liparis tanakae]|uniref:Uncharacterized protein n=1 Tax=Liparis tanakae TaxID=230148 RepID=A0A4Z2F3K9_9TELE|nr:hypothetical protein EYF80_054354 [Liparis tanakae]